MDSGRHVGTHQADLIESVLPQLFPSSFVLVYARSRHCRLERLRVSFIEQSLGGHCCRFCLPRWIGTNTSSPNCCCCCAVICCSSRPRGNGCMDFQQEGFGRGSLCPALFPYVSKIQTARRDSLVR